MGLKEEILRRRTFGIVSHPDAGKNNINRKVTPFWRGPSMWRALSKAIRSKKGATSDFMEIERQRGISVATSVMGFEFNGYKVKYP